MSFDTIVAYTYEAELICPPCMRQVAAFANEANGRNAEFVGLQDLLDRWAKDVDINREDEHSFDSDDFPKVVLSIQLGDGCQRCDRCGEHIDSDDCITYPHRYTYGSDGRFHSQVCQNGRCRNVGQGDPCGDGDCLWHPDNPENPYTCSDWVDNDWCDHAEHQRAICPEFAEDGSCIHSDHMAKAGL